MNEEIMKEFKLFRDQVYQKFAEYDNVIRTLIEGNSEAIDDIVISMLEGGNENV